MLRAPAIPPQRSLFVGLTLAVASFLSACAINPVSGRPQAVITSEAGEIRQGQEAAKEVEKYMGLLDDPKLAAYLDEVGQRLVTKSQRSQLDFHFAIVEMKEPNAFALPGGYVYVSRGLLTLVNSEDELATVVGHEIGHVAARHSVSRQTANVPLVPIRIAAAIGGAATSIVSPGLGRVIAGTGQLPGALALATFSRSQENEADRLGQDYAAAAGWDPKGIATFMDTLARESELEGRDPDRMSFFQSHPTSPDRSKDGLEYAKELEISKSYEPISKSHEAFLNRLVGLVIGPAAAEGVFVEQLFIHPDIGLALTFPKDWKTINQRNAVVAHPEDESAYVALELAGEGDDPMKAAQEFASKNRIKAKPTARTINGLPAAEVEMETGSRFDRDGIHLTWIASDGMVYRVAGMGKKSGWAGLSPIFRKTAGSFHVPSKAELEQVTELRVALVRAREGEALEALMKRSGSELEPKEIAVGNGLQVDTRLKNGQLIKIAKRTRYTPKPKPKKVEDE
jgi:predicted Zn-dependent protease